MQFFKTTLHRLELDKVLFAVIYVLGNVYIYIYIYIYIYNGEIKMYFLLGDGGVRTHADCDCCA